MFAFVMVQEKRAKKKARNRTRDERLLTVVKAWIELQMCEYEHRDYLKIAFPS